MKLFSLILIMIVSFIKTDDSNCSSYKDCFTCSICNDILLTECDCIWSNNSCEKLPSKLIYNKEWWNKFILCTDNSSKELQNLYCGEAYKEKEKSKNVIIKYPNVNSYYGKQFLYCNYEIVLDKKKKDYVTLKIKMGKLLGHNAPLVGISYEYETEFIYNHIYDIGTIQFDNLKIYNAQIIKIHLFSMINYTSNPITIKFDYSKGIKNVLKFVIVIISLFVSIVIIALGLYCFFKNRKLNKNKELIKYKKINALITNQFKTYKFEENNNNNLKCSHCREEIKNTEEVSKTNCNHIFHCICLKDYLQKNDLQCPHCKYNFEQFFNHFGNNTIKEENLPFSYNNNNNNYNDNNNNDNNDNNYNNNDNDDNDNNNNNYNNNDNNNNDNNNIDNNNNENIINDNNYYYKNYNEVENTNRKNEKKNEIIENVKEKSVINNGMNNLNNDMDNFNLFSISKPNINNNYQNQNDDIYNHNSVHISFNNDTFPIPHLNNQNNNKDDKNNFPV